MIHRNLPPDWRSLEDVAYINPPANEGLTEHIEAVPLPSAKELTRDVLPVVRTTVSPAEAQSMAAVAGDVYPGLSGRLMAKGDEGPVELVGMLALQAERARANTALGQLPYPGDTKYHEAIEAARVALLMGAITDSLANTPSPSSQPETSIDVGGALSALGIRADTNPPLDAYLTTRVVARTVDGVKNTHRSHSGFLKRGFDKVLQLFNPKYS